MSHQLTTSERVAFVTVPNVELLSAGYKWPLSTGDWTVTPETLAEVVTAYSDRGFRRPIVKIGHLDPRFNGEDPFSYDGNPAYGVIENLRLSDDKMTLIGDLVGVPTWLAEAMPYAYPSRSVEILENVQSGTGRRHRYVLTALALLGETPPAVQTLADVKSLFVLQSSQSVYSDAEDSQEQQVPKRASVNIDSVYHAFAEAEIGGENRWAIRDIWSDFVIAADVYGGLWKVPWFEHEGEIVFGEPRVVSVSYVETDGLPLAASEGPELLDRLDLDIAKAIAPHSTPTSDKSWDGPANKARLGNSRSALRKAFAWQDTEGDPEVKNSYRFVHHEVNEDGSVGAANLTACSTGIGVLNGGRGGTTVPASDRAGIYAHLAKHLKDADREPAPLQGALEPESHVQVSMVPSTSSSTAGTWTTTIPAIATTNVEVGPTPISYAQLGDTGSQSTDKESQVTPEALRALIGLTEAADDEEVVDRLKQLVASEEAPVESPPAEEQSEPETEVEAIAEEPVEEPALVAASKINVPDGFQLLDEATLAELKNAAAEGRAARAQQKIEHRDRVLTAAVQQGKFPPAQLATYRARWDRDPELTEDLVTNHLAAGTIPVSPVGHDEEIVEPDISQFLMFPDLDVSRRG